MVEIFFVGLGGFFGAISRFLLSRWVSLKLEGVLPYGTLIVNVLGSFLLGFIMTFSLEKGLTHPYLRLAITTGFIGALTTFSTFSYETVVLIEERDWFFAGMNILSNLLLGLVSVMGGIILAKAIS